LIRRFEVADARRSGDAYTEPVKIQIHRLDPLIPLPRHETRGAAGFDLAARENMTIAPGEVALVPTGLVIQVPENYFLGIFARSSTPMKRGLMVANGVGIVDSDYCGPKDEIKIEVLNFTQAPVMIQRGDRLARGVVLSYAQAEWVEVDEPPQPTRGGFGATGN
jgi:dUTP pyrophosphatase